MFAALLSVGCCCSDSWTKPTCIPKKRVEIKLNYSTLFFQMFNKCFWLKYYLKSLGKIKLSRIRAKQRAFVLSTGESIIFWPEFIPGIVFWQINYIMFFGQFNISLTQL
jgi:hypothetical protein